MFQDEEAEVFKRDFAAPTLEDHFDKSVLPKVMQVTNLFHCLFDSMEDLERSLLHQRTRYQTQLASIFKCMKYYSAKLSVLHCKK